MSAPKHHHAARAAKAPVLRSGNDNAPGPAAVAQTAAPYPSITSKELEVLGPLIEALVRLAANDLSATTLCSGEP